MQAGTNCVADANRARSAAQNFCDAPDFSNTHILLLKKTILDLQIFSQIGKTMNKVKQIDNESYNEF